ncbi:peroxidase 1 isoform X1 [Setaria viridis]|uniref:peroxidase 1 isoform X1 n=1 Tax=Setaria viridis TaxID=4556 RepID=UPI00149350E5|nr:peroxidase 1 isoform X1 [Setaria viridis]
MASRAAVVVLLLSAFAAAAASAQLDEKFYSQSCPSVEDVVRKEMVRALSAAPSLAGPLLRMHFHDCFVRGCDGSVLLDSTANNTAEKDAKPNLTLRGFGFIERVKAAVEKACPDTVSCADVLALMARDAVWLVSTRHTVPSLQCVYSSPSRNSQHKFADSFTYHAQSKGPFWAVPLGRRDGRVSISNETDQLPPPTGNFTELTQIFATKNLDAKDLVVLSAGHTLGTSHCFSFSDRLYNFTGMDNAHDTDPTLDPMYMARLRGKCPSLDDNTTLVEMDPGSFKTFDLSYFGHVAKRRGLFHSDGALLTDPFTRAYVLRHATGAYREEFFADFAASMVKMGSVEVLTGSQGEIRKKCSVVN